MEAFETTLTGSDGNIDGLVTHISAHAYQFTSLDNALHLTIAKNEKGKWIRLAGSEPYFSGWVDELSEHIAAHTKADVKPVATRKVTAPVTEKKVVTAKKAVVPATEKKAVTAKKVPAKAEASTAATKTKRTTAAPSVKKAAVKAEHDKKITAKTAPVKKTKVSSSATKK